MAQYTYGLYEYDPSEPIQEIPEAASQATPNGRLPKHLYGHPDETGLLLARNRTQAAMNAAESYILDLSTDDNSPERLQNLQTDMTPTPTHQQLFKMIEATARYAPRMENGSFPHIVPIARFARIKVEVDHKTLLEEFLTELDDRYHDDKSDPTEITAAMKKAARIFTGAVLAEYQCWQYKVEPETTRPLDLVPWIRDHPLTTAQWRVRR